MDCRLRSPMRARPLLWLCCFALTLVGSACGSSEVRIELDPSVRFQTLSGWEATVNSKEAPPPGYADYASALLDRTVAEVGINRVRLEIRSGAENTGRGWERSRRGEITYKDWQTFRYATVNDNADPRTINWAGFDFSELDDEVEIGALPLRQRLQARGEPLSINLTYVAFTPQTKGGHYVHADPEEYAEFILAAYLHLRTKYGLVPDTLEVILEPDNVPEWSDGAVLGRAMVATARRLRENGFTPRFVAPSTTDMGSAARYFDQMAGVKGALDDLVELSYHRYRGVSDANLKAIVSRAKDHGLRTAMLELWFGRGNYEVLHEDIKAGSASAWQGRVMQGMFDVDRSDPKRPRLSLKEDVRYNAQYFRYLRAGARRIGADSSARAFDPVAFINAKGGYAVVIKVTAKAGGAVSVHGLPPGTYGISYATAAGSAEAKAQPVGPDGVLRASIPGAGVLSIYDPQVVAKLQAER